MQSSLPVSKV